jgi:hypothetical protein
VGALVVTLAPIHGASIARGHVRSTLDLRDFILNLLLLAPVGAGLRWYGWRPSRILGLVAALSCGIELLQFALPIGRNASIADVVANTAGAGVAAWVAPRLTWALGASGIAARWLSATALAGWIAQASVTAWALQRDVPVAPEYWGQWAHVFGDTERLNGEVTAFTIQGHAVPDDSVPNTEVLRTVLAGDTVRVNVAVNDLEPSVGRAQIAAVTNGAGDLVAGFERHGCRIRFRVRLRGERLGLRPLSALVITSCQPEPGVTTIAGLATSSSLSVAAAWGSEVRHTTLALAPSLGWRLFVPRRWTGGAWDLLGSIAWLSLWGTLVAFWLQGAWPRHLARTALVYAVGLLGSAALVAAVSGLTPGTPGDVVGVAIGWGLGGLAGRLRPAS